MINIFDKYREIFVLAINKIAKDNDLKIDQKSLAKVIVEPTKNLDHGDIACNGAMVMTKTFNSVYKKPRDLADEITKAIQNVRNDNNSPFISAIQKIEIAGPGFINVFLDNSVFHKIAENLLNKGSFEFKNIGQGEKINLEYASPNPTGPIHIGHTRGSIYGDVLANLLKKSGYDVLKEYYVNDAGSQIFKLVKSAYLRYIEAFGQKITIPEGLYPGEYLIDIANTVKNEFNNKFLDLIDPNDPIEPNTAKYLEFREFIVQNMVNLVIDDLENLGIKHDSYFSEKEKLHDTNKINEAINILDKKGLVYEGQLEIPKTAKGVGALPEGYKQEDQTLFKSTLFGDDQDRVIKKADGSLTYFAGDLAYVMSKYERGAKKFIMPLGFDHAGYVKRLTAAVKALTNDECELKIILCQMVKFIKNGEPLKMSKRSGNFITAREVVDEVGADALRFIMLTRKNDTPFDFNLNKVIEQSKDNPIFYVQYAHARCCSVERNIIAENLVKNLDSIEANDDYLKLLTDESEIAVLKKISQFPRIIDESVQKLEPHKIAFYLQDLSAALHSLWNKGIDNPDLKFIIKDRDDLTIARLFMVRAIRIILSTGLDIFNIKALQEMK